MCPLSVQRALDYVPRQVDHDCLQELRWLYARRGLEEARCDLTAQLVRRDDVSPSQGAFPVFSAKLCVSV
jgi:transposase-like protein